MRRFICSFLFAVFAASPLRADTPEELVKWIYTSLQHAVPAEQKSLDYLMSPAQRIQFFSERMITLFNNNDSYGDDLAAACIDFGIAIPGQDFDRNEIAQTIQTVAAGDEESQRVVARFTNFSIPAEITYDFIIENGRWVIDDIDGAGVRLSAINCPHKSAATAPAPAPAPQITSYCYQDDFQSLRLDVAADGNATFRFDSIQSNGHGCGGQGRAARVPAGWVYEEELNGRACKIEFTVTQDQGIRLSDPEWACKPTLCGQRAVIDGITYPRESQVICSMMRN
ncbi:MAG: hypothetical protein AB3N11_16750 [Arenibacterium sp.]